MEGVDLTYSTQWKGNSGPDCTTYDIFIPTGKLVGLI